MKKYFIAIFLMLLWLEASPSPAASAAPPPMAVPSTLAIAEIKITGDEFVILRNNTGKDIAAKDLGNYWLTYFNNYQPLNAGVNSSSQQLPSVNLGNGQSVLLSSNGMSACGAAAVGKLSVSLADGAGYLQVSQMDLGSLGVSQLPVDFVSWGAGGVITGVSSKDPAAVYYRAVGSTANGWQLASIDSSDACQLDVASAGSLSTGLTQANSPVPSVVNISGSNGTDMNIPAADIGLAVPQISEILPNPAAPKTDANDEYIELYNSNDKPFDLSGFILQTGTTTVHKYTFPSGTSIQPHQFSAFYSSDTGISMSNSGGQVKLLDPAGNLLEQTDQYGSTKDGYAWVFAGGLWQWTTTPTPEAANIIATPLTSKSSKISSTSSKQSVKGVSTTNSRGNSIGTGPSGTTSAVSLHPLVLAGVGALAVVYACYEYRHDLANQLYKFRRNREARRAAG